MGAVHDLLEAHGKQGALSAGLDRSVVEAAALYMGDEDGALNFVYSGWAQCALPHRRLADDRPWEIAVERIRLVVEPGRRPKDGYGPLEFLGVPFGSHARLILLYLQTEALRTGSREVELGRSLRDWLGRIGVSVGGRTGKLVKDQAERISRCRLTFHIQGAKLTGLINQTIVDRALFIEEDGGSQGRLSLETAKLSEGFFEQLRRHPVPLEEAAIRAINNNPAALDCYLWLAYRLHVLPAPKLVTWIWTFREALKRSGAIEALFARFDVQLKATGYLAMSGQIVDASIVSAPKQRNTEAEKAEIRAGRIPPEEPVRNFV